MLRMQRQETKSLPAENPSSRNPHTLLYLFWQKEAEGGMGNRRVAWAWVLGSLRYPGGVDPWT